MPDEAKKLRDLKDRKQTTGRAYDVLREYFQSRHRELVAALACPAGHHAGLIGTHREIVQRMLLEALLPRRYGVGTGMVYGALHRSKQADVVVWDAATYPAMPVAGHTLFFAEAVRLVLECKSNWSESELVDVLEKCGAVRDIIAFPTSTMEWTVAMLAQDVHAMKNGTSHEGAIIYPHHIATAAIFASGGSSLCAKQLDEILDELDDCWPDAMLLLESGRLITKHYSVDETGSHGWIEFRTLTNDALLAFAATLIRLLSERTPAVEIPDFLEMYTTELLGVPPDEHLDFPLFRFVPHRKPLWTSSESTGTEDRPSEPNPGAE